MGIHPEMLTAMCDLPLPKGFRVAELGDQRIGPDGKGYRRLAMDWYLEHGCSAYVSIDGNSGGTMIWDLNRPLPSTMMAGFDLVTDFGTGEHIFNQAQVWQTLHELCVVGGYIIYDRPIAGYPAHGYYCVDPCLLDEVAEVNHYRVVLRGTRKTTRGTLMRGIWQRVLGGPFVVPQQGRYRASLTIC